MTMWTRVAVGWLSLVVAAVAAAAPQATTGNVIVYVSGYSPQITRYRFDDAAGRLTALGATPAPGNPSFLAIDAQRRFLYAVNEVEDGQVTTFAIDPDDGALQARGRVSSGGSTPAYVGIDHSGKWVLAANYKSGTVGVLPVRPDGSLGAAIATPWVGANAHEIVADPANRFVYVPCLGSNYVAQLAFAATTGALRPTAHVAVLPPQRGPRHLVFHPDRKHAYLIDETSSAMEAFAVDPASGQLSRMQVLSTRPAGATGFNKAAEVAIDRQGRFLYGSNRGDDNIVIYALDAEGRMSLVGFQKTGGRWPRDFTIDPTGRWLLVANKRSDNVVVFAVDAHSGLLTETGAPVAAPAPSFVEVVALPGR
jgi:6-phosphogluconolactonase